MSGYYKTSRKRKAQAAAYGTAPYAPDVSVLSGLFAGPGFVGVKKVVQQQHRLRQTTTSFRSGRDSSGEISPQSLLLKNMQDNQRASTFDNGHPFETRDERIYYTHPRVTLRGTAGAFYQGCLYGSDTGGSDLLWPATFASNLDWSTTGFSSDDVTYGVRAMAKVAPDQSPTNLLRALGELKQELPRVPLEKLMKSGGKISPHRYEQNRHQDTSLGAVLNPGDELLNYLFGVQPTLQDAYSLFNTVIHAGKLIGQWQRDAGRIVRRSLVYDPIVTTSDSRIGSSRMYRAFGSCFQTNNPTSWTQSIMMDQNAQVSVSRTVTNTDKYSFVGAFTYYIDPLLERLGPAGSAVNIAQHLLGLSADANTIWQLIPWTWLIDWITDLGDCISLMSRINRDALVLKYGYLMRESESKVSLTVDRLVDHTGVVYRDIRSDHVITRKVRIRSTPYGFGLNTASFSTTQWAILAALGFTSGDRQLRYL